MPYHTFLFTDKLEKTKLKEDEIWEAKLSCGCIIQFKARTIEEIRKDGLRCPIHPNKYAGFISPIFREIVAFRRVKLVAET